MKKKSVLILSLCLAQLLSLFAQQYSIFGESNFYTGVPDDFSFSLVWGCFGVSSYDSQTGRLVKTIDATNPDEYITTFFLNDEEKEEIYSLIKNMKPESYPDKYNPISGGSKPSRDIILTVKYNGKTKTISCENISLVDNTTSSKEKEFMKVYNRIVEIITSSDEWKALPEYEFLYR